MNYSLLFASKDAKDISEILFAFEERKKETPCQSFINNRLFRFDPEERWKKHSSDAVWFHRKEERNALPHK